MSINYLPASQKIGLIGAAAAFAFAGNMILTKPEAPSTETTTPKTFAEGAGMDKDFSGNRILLSDNSPSLGIK